MKLIEFDPFHLHVPTALHPPPLLASLLSLNYNCSWRCCSQKQRCYPQRRTKPGSSLTDARNKTYKSAKDSGWLWVERDEVKRQKMRGNIIRQNRVDVFQNNLYLISVGIILTGTQRYASRVFYIRKGVDTHAQRRRPIKLQKQFPN